MNPLHHTVSAHVLDAMLTRASAAGCDRDALLAQAAIPPSAATAPASTAAAAVPGVASSAAPPDGQARILPLQFASLMRAIWRQTGDEFMGFTERPSRVGTFPLMMHSVMSAATLGEALRHGCHFYRVLSDEISLGLREDDDGLARFCLHLRRPDLDTGHVLTETILLCWYRFACWLINRRILLRETTFAYPAPAHVAEYHQLYPCPHHFGEGETTLAFDASVLALPVTRSRDELKALISELPLGFFVKPVFQGSFGHRVRSQLLRPSEAGYADLEEVAAALFMTGRTLRRKLKEEGTSFQLIKDDLRRDQALALLRESDDSVQAVALRVGFREATVFIKAFRQWTGMTPGDYRARLKRRRGG